MNVTIKDIARSAGVSYSTVSKALNNSPLVKEATKKKILTIAHELGYHPNIAAKNLVSKKSETIGVVWPTVQRAVWSNLITFINEKLMKKSYHMILSINPAESAITLFNQFPVDGILVFGNKLLDDINTSIPLLYYGNTESPGYSTINVSRRDATFTAVKYLHELGHAKLAFVGNTTHNDRNQQEKYLGFLEGIMQFSLPSHPNMKANTVGLEWEDGYQAMKELLQSDYQPTAVISGSYEITIGVWRALKEAGKSVPEDISIVSYDNIPQMEEFDVPVTSVGVPLENIAEEIVSHLLHLINGDTPVLTKENLEAELVPRESCKKLTKVNLK